MTTLTHRLYGRRKGRPLRLRKTQLVEDLLPQLQIAHPGRVGGISAGTEAPRQPTLNPKELFGFDFETLWLEIGFGGGEHLATQAERNKEFAFIGCEPFVNGVAGLLDHVDRLQLKNVRIFPDDARYLIDALPPASVSRCFVLFPDPWPKARHTDRRFISQTSAKSLARVMVPGAELRLASDDPGMIAWFREIMNKTEDFICERDSPLPPPDWVETRYEQKALKAGRQPAHMTYKRK